MNRIIILLTFIAELKAAHVHLVPNNAGMKNVTGELTLVQCEDNLIEITGKVYGLTPGLHGIHVHEKGDLRDGCMSTGPHFNPENVTHGGQNSPVRHVGDLGNILANESGVADVNIKDSIISFTGNNNIIGRAIVIHSGEDDLGRGSSPLSASTGNSGDRWACGIIEAE
ncbi:superoxide dismutase [Cu-Zn], chloroplastic-like [Bombus pyrosoma]|uniref:superoxide dismutase [Cu-Zn], chloroplastic-like n=1 Tax=Bombus pyrosoma TaxID=396416 RepID=UPI001CB9D0F0|nr:superoxide dismutase [Cu-Zn], chloroplastic-like [Bombus pyrosoma]XP_043587502.1 superoxide dismutase [Cu-Zn], chloroplastic-like [Bombus pyrosoma]XP_043587503.1 superoxide dismutase [Cu-Zn], chloroplastic-like [Bombus pyrosoma]